jgi:adenine-specific DNA methylase
MKRKASVLDQPNLPGVDIERQPALHFDVDSAKSIIEKQAGPPNLGKAVKVSVPNFANPRRPKTCLEVDFPIVPINALSRLEGNAGKPIYQMSKWWARRRSSVFRAMLLAAAMEAPIKKNEDGTPVLDADGIPVPDETEAAKAVWDVYYANHQKAENFKDLKVLDCFMGGGTTLVEGSRLGFQVSGVDLNPVAWFVVKNELACTDPEDVKAFFNQIEAEVKPVIQPFYVTECPRGHAGRWFRKATAGAITGEQRMPAEFDPLTLEPEERKHYRYEGPEVIYTFWAKHGPCSKPGCGHRTPIFRTPVIAEKKLGVKYVELTCKSCKTAFHAELGAARMAPSAERVVLNNEFPFTELSQPFAKRLMDYAKGSAAECLERAKELAAMVEFEEGLKCPQCGIFAGEFLRDVLNMHSAATRRSQIDKKHLKIQPGRNSTKPVYSYLLVSPKWLVGSGSQTSIALGGYPGAPPSESAKWWEARAENLALIEVRGRIKLDEDLSTPGSSNLDDDLTQDEADEVPDDPEEVGTEAEDRKKFGLPRFINLSDGTLIDTRKGTIPQQSHFTCGSCGKKQDFRESIERFGFVAPASPYAIQGHCPECDASGTPYSGKFFTTSTNLDLKRLVHAENEWATRSVSDLANCWPVDEIPHTYMTHHANFALPKQGYTHWWKMFNSRQLMVHSLMGRMISAAIKRPQTAGAAMQALGAHQQYLRNQCMFAFWHAGRDHFAPHFGNPNYSPKNNVVEVGLWTKGYGSWTSTISSVIEGNEWSRNPWEAIFNDGTENKSERIQLGDPIRPAQKILCTSSSDLGGEFDKGTLDLVVTDPPFGDNLFYSDLANYFYAWIRLPLVNEFPDLFGATKTPSAQEALAPRLLPEDQANDYYKVRLTACWSESHRLLKQGGLLAFTFHHSEDSQWAIVLESLFDAGFLLEQTFPIASDEQKGEGWQFGAKGTEYDIIHVCRKRLIEPEPVSWAKMRQWVKAELGRLRLLLDSYRERKISDADIRVILRGKALEFYSRHYGKVLTAADEPMPLAHALAGINQLLDEGTGDAGALPPSVVQPVAYQYLRLFTTKESRSADDVNKSLFGTALRQKDIADRAWIEERNKTVSAIAIDVRFEHHRKRPRREMKTEIDQAHFLIGAAMPNSGINLEDELTKDTWMLRKSVDAVLEWYARATPNPNVRNAAMLARTILRSSVERLRQSPGGLEAQLSLFNDWEESES